MSTNENNYNWLTARLIKGLFPQYAEMDLYDDSEQLPEIIEHISKNVGDIKLSTPSPAMKARLMIMFKLTFRANRHADPIMAAWDDEMLAAYFKLHFADFKHQPLSEIQEELKQATLDKGELIAPEARQRLAQALENYFNEDIEAG